MNTYIGICDSQHWYEITKNGTPFDPRPSQKLYNHSPDGFSWSYYGSGPAQLALGILLEETGDPEVALKHYMDFKREVIASLPCEKFEMTSQHVVDWLAKQK